VWDPLRGNARTGRYQQRAAATRAVIEAVTQAATRAGITGPYEHVTVQLHWAPGDRRRADADNLAPLQKACADALARGRKDLPGLHLVPDDTPQWMTKLMPRIEPPPTPAGLWLTVEVDPRRHRQDPRSVPVHTFREATNRETVTRNRDHP